MFSIKQEIDSKIGSIKSISEQKHLSNDIRNKSLIKLTHQLLDLLKLEKRELKK